MPPISFPGALCTGHECYPPRPLLAGVTSTVFVNGQPAALSGATMVPHACGTSAHAGVVSGGSGTVFFEGRPVARIGDAVSCGSALAQGSPSVFAGG